jgi:hypothetical protein
MRQRHLFVVFALVAPLLTVSPASAAVPPSQGGANGGISLTVHAHSSQFTDTLFPTSPLPFPVTEESSGTYSSIPCSRPAPFNDTALNFTPDFPGVEDPASVRHFVEVTLTPTTGNQGTVEGEITTILCLDGRESRNRIFFSFEGTYKQTGGAIRIDGTFEITGGTGTFADITGEGTISGEIACFNVRCAERGVYSDLAFALQGTFSDPSASGF